MTQPGLFTLAALEGSARNLAYPPAQRLSMAIQALDGYAPLVDDLQGQIDRVRAMHHERTGIAVDGVTVSFGVCAHDDDTWPCETIRAADHRED